MDADQQLNGVNNPPLTNEFSTVVTVIKVVIFAIFLLPLAQYTIVSQGGNETNATTSDNDVNNLSVPMVESEVENATEPVENVKEKVIEKVIVKQPACPRAYVLVILEEICTDLMLKKEFCTPEDFYDRSKHKIPRSAKNQSSTEAKVPAIINYAMGGLLITSVGAALVELYKAKREPQATKDGKNPLSRKCSLADLTVMKHHRKELARREIMEVPEEGGQLLQLGLRPRPLIRRCSFPVGPNRNGFGGYDVAFDSRRNSVIDSTRRIPIVDSSLGPVNENRSQPLIVDGRRTSIADGIMPIDRKMAVSEESPERRHHSRLVHRH